MQDLHELLRYERGELARERAVDGDDATERRRRIGRQRRAIGVVGRRSQGAAARVAVLDDHAGRDCEFLHEPGGGVEIEQVVERELLAAVLGHHREEVATSTRIHVVRGALVRVLAVGEIGHLDELAQVPVGERLRIREPVGDRDVVARRVRERLGGQLAPSVEAEIARGLAQLVQHEAVALRIDQHRDRCEVLRGGAHHRGPADVDRLDDIRLARLPPGGHVPERVEVDDHEIDRLDAVLGQRGLVALVVATREQRAVDTRVQRLHATAEHLRDAGQVLDAGRLQTVFLEVGAGTARRDQLDAHLGKAMGELQQPCLVRNRDERSLDRHVRAFLAMTSRSRAPRATSSTTAGRSRCSTSWMRARRPSGASS